MTNEYVAKVEELIRQTVDPKDFKLVVSNIGVVPDFSSLYTTNAGPYTATVQVQLQDEHREIRVLDRAAPTRVAQRPVTPIGRGSGFKSRPSVVSTPTRGTNGRGRVSGIGFCQYRVPQFDYVQLRRAPSCGSSDGARM